MITADSFRELAAWLASGRSREPNYPSIKECTLDDVGILNMIEGIFRHSGVLGSLGTVAGLELRKPGSTNSFLERFEVYGFHD